jgi:CRISPR/Cas system-associated protein Csx1
MSKKNKHRATLGELKPKEAHQKILNCIKYDEGGEFEDPLQSYMLSILVDMVIRKAGGLKKILNTWEFQKGDSKYFSEPLKELYGDNFNFIENESGAVVGWNAGDTDVVSLADDVDVVVHWNWGDK